MVTHCAAQFGLVTVDLPCCGGAIPVCAVATKAAIMDAGIAWLFALLKEIPWDGKGSPPAR